ncbi:class I adenylate-forming enzyme family protein [Steroidobacter sp.]|uniref:class I adenylate-forming enzyme family protein n=1 Tax=Steroidobacter sp. TaxID=1978227 RepID=UPI001A410701|nr:class I adenylate-forming enzyme family protein [Steroidobacter sp.]MBL8267315.1 acyl--CoA ligase [Steroidobacter sp.]
MNSSSPETLLDQDFGLIAELVHAYARERPRQPALIDEQRAIDYGELDQRMDQVALSLQRDNVGSGAAIAICAASCVDYAVVFLGALRAGVAVAPLSPSSTAAALVTMLADSGARILFLDEAIASALATVALPSGLQLVRLDAAPGVRSLEAWLAPAGGVPTPVSIAPDAPFNIIYSSGTTGAPKGIVQPHSMRWSHVRRARNFAYDREAVTICSTPLYSNTTLVSFFPALAGGGAVVLMAKFDGGKFLEMSQRHRVSHAMLVPVQYQRLMDRADFDSYDLGSYRMKFCTSAPFAPALKANILKRWPGGLIEYYGMTEGGGTCMLLAHQFPDKLHTVGQPVPGHDIRLIDEQGKEVARGEIGEVVGRSPAMMKEYFNQPGKTAEAEWFDGDGNRFIRTGDVGRFDAEGFLTLMDRRKDMIISGGFNIYPSDLEAVLLQNPAVRDAAVVGVPSREWGETPVAFVVIKAESAATAADIKQWVNERVGKTQRLSAVELTAELPRNAIGKVLKRELRDQFVAA